jgi:hypothetical protein
MRGQKYVHVEELETPVPADVAGQPVGVGN